MQILKNQYNISSTFNRVFPLFIISLPLLFIFIAPSFLKAQGTGEIRIVIRNKTYEFSGGIVKPDQPVTILLQNMDNTEHGFTSKLMEEFSIEVETAGATTFGKGIKGVHIKPGEKVRIHFTPSMPGSFNFQCDIHPSMKGELFVLSVEAV